MCSVKNYVLGFLFTSFALAGCASLDQTGANESIKSILLEVDRSFLSADTVDLSTDPTESGNSIRDAGEESSQSNISTGMVPLTSAVGSPSENSTVPNLSFLFADKGTIEIVAEEMSMKDFVHYIFGEVLAVNYVLDPSLAASDVEVAKPITLSIVKPLTEREIFSLVNDLLITRDVKVRNVGDAFFIHPKGAAGIGDEVALAFGRETSDVPNTSQTILQIAPLNFGIKLLIQSSIVQLTNTMVTPSYDQNALMIRGKRSNVLRALELLDMLDIPAARGRFIGMINLDFITPEEFTNEVNKLLDTEGLLAAAGSENQRNIVMVPLEKLGAVAVFSSTKYLLDRVEYWASLVDVAGNGSDQQYFFYQPKFARAKDLFQSLSPLISDQGGLSQLRGSSTTNLANESTGSAPSSSRASGISSDKMKVVVDERSNALVFYTTGSEYRALFPLLARLDTLPKQVSLEITIAEVTLQDEFKHGFEWALSRGEVSLTTQGAFGVSEIGGLGLFINGTEGPLTANFLSSNSLVNVLSRPTLTVRDGVSATINVGSDISVIGSTTVDPINGERQTTTSEYRKTGVDISVTPTVNSQGIIVMEVDQTISNSIPSSSGASGNPDIFERSLSTEVVARSGQTVILGGLISANYNQGGSSAPRLGDIPLLGNLFKSSSDSQDRTELVMLITPKLIENLDQWQIVMSDFKQGLKYLYFDE
jgi:general secretion pathway protein D